MSICSQHRTAVKGCRSCELEPRDVLPGFDVTQADADAAGLFTCKCGFAYYKLVNECPCCGTRFDPTKP